jgi:hypothetical protein
MHLHDYTIEQHKDRRLGIIPTTAKVMPRTEQKIRWVRCSPLDNYYQEYSGKPNGGILKPFGTSELFGREMAKIPNPAYIR